MDIILKKQIKSYLQQRTKKRMGKPFLEVLGTKKNIVFLGEAGCGKSELALNFAAALSDGTCPVHFFDLDQTKPLYRSRDARKAMEEMGVHLHYEEQLLDAPTLVGGVRGRLSRQDNRTILDVGGGESGARMVGRFSREMNSTDTAVYYVINPYRPWSRELLTLDQTLSAILQATRIERVQYICNPNLGECTGENEFLDGVEKTRRMLDGAASIEAACAHEGIYANVKDCAALPVLPLRLYLRYDF